jgi:hypothetical protein
MKIRVTRARLRRPSRWTTSLVMVASVMFLRPPAVEAAEWRFAPELRAGYELDDNATLVEPQFSAPSIQGYILEANAVLGYRTPRTRLDLTPVIRLRDYDNDDFDSDDMFLRFDVEHSGLKSRLRVRGDYENEAIRTAERTDADPGTDDPDDINGDETGRVFGGGSRERLRIRPEWTYRFTQRSAVSADLDYVDVDYEDALNSSLVPYSDVHAELSLSHEFSRNNFGYVRAGMRRYEPDDLIVGIANEVDGLSLTTGFERRFSETTRFRLAIGVEQSELSNGDSDTNVIGNVALIRRLERTTLLAEYRRSVTASGTGRIAARDAVNFSVRHSFTERFSGGVALRSYQSDPLVGAVTTQQEYVQFGAQLAYAFSRTISARADFRFTQIERTAALGPAESISMIVWLIYQPSAMSVSR